MDAVTWALVAVSAVLGLALLATFHHAARLHERQAALYRRLIETHERMAEQAESFADRVTELRKAGYTTGGEPKPEPPEEWDNRVLDFIAHLADPGPTEEWLAGEVRRQRAKRGKVDWDGIVAELDESTVGYSGAPVNG